MRVLVRIRPLQEHETPSQCITPEGSDTIRLTPPLSDERVCVSRVYTETATQVAVFEGHFFPIVAHVISGGQGTVIAYGTTGSGKRYSVEGTPLHPGLLPFSLLSIFTYKNEHEPSLTVAVSWYEIHGESVHDLFSSSEEELKIMDKGKGKGLSVDNLTVLQISSPEEAFELINNVQLDYERQSHTVFSIHVTNKSTRKEGCLSFVVMVGSEHPLGSLNNFRLVIESLYSRRPQIPFHKSKLTLVLKESLTSPNALTTLICTLSPSRESTFETSATLALASQAVHVNSKADKALATPEWNYRPRVSRSPQAYNNTNNIHDTKHGNYINNKQTFHENQQYSDNEQENTYNNFKPNIKSISDFYDGNGAQEEDEQNTDYSYKLENGNSINNNFQHVNNHQPNNNNYQPNNYQLNNNNNYYQTNGHVPSPTISERSTSSHPSSTGSEFRGDRKLKLLKTASNKDIKRGTGMHAKTTTNNYITPQSPRSTPATSPPSPPSPPSFRFALTHSPPTPHKERVASSQDSTVEVQKLRMQLQKALQEINGFKIYKDVIDKNIVTLRDSLAIATDAKAICEKELKSKEILLRKKNKEIEGLNKSTKEAVSASERAAKDRAAMKLRLDEIEKGETDKLKMIEEALEEANEQRQENIKMSQEFKRQLETLQAENTRVLDQLAQSQHNMEDKDKEISVLTEEIIRLTQVVEDGDCLKNEIVSFDSKTKSLQKLVDEKDKQIENLTQSQALAEKMAARDSRTANIMFEATIAQLRKQISDLQFEIKSLREIKPEPPKDVATFSHPSSLSHPSSSSSSLSHLSPSLSHPSPSTSPPRPRSPASPSSSLFSSYSPLQPSSHSTSNFSNLLSSLPRRPPSQPPILRPTSPSSPPPSSSSPFTLPPPVSSSKPLYHPIPSTPTSLSNPLLDPSTLSLSLTAPRAPSSSRNPPHPSSVPPPLTPTSLQNIPFSSSSLPLPPPPVSPQISPPSPFSSFSSSSSSPFLTSDDSQAFSHKHWAQILKNILPEQENNNHVHSPPFNMAQVQMTIDNVRKLVSKHPSHPSPSLPSPSYSSSSHSLSSPPSHKLNGDFAPSAT